MTKARSPASEPAVDLSVVIPFYNEEGSTAELLEELERVLGSMGKRFEVLAVDDGSRDGTYAALAAGREGRPWLRVIGLRRNFGQTAALSAGFDAARGDVVVTLDGDLQNDPSDIPKLVEKLAEGFDIVSGWRRRRSAGWVFRRAPSRIANALIRCVSGTALHDSGCTLKAYRRWVVRDIHLYGEQHRLIPAVASWAGASMPFMRSFSSVIRTPRARSVPTGRRTGPRPQRVGRRRLPTARAPARSPRGRGRST